MEPNKTPPTRDEPLSAYVRRTRGDVEGCGPDWLADRIAELEAALANLAALKEAAQAVVDAVIRSRHEAEAVGDLIDAAYDLRAVLASADSESREETP